MTREYPAEFKRAIDGDTYELFFDYGFDAWQKHQVRLKGWDAPEKGHPLYIPATNGAALIMLTHTLIVTTYKRDSGTYDMSLVRYIADVWVDGIGDLGLYLQSYGYAKPWDGKGPHPW